MFKIEIQPHVMKLILYFASISGLLSVAFGAFGAHVLKSTITPKMAETFETAVRYQFYHTLALLLVAVLFYITNNGAFVKSAYFFMGGIILFSGSLYALVFSSIPTGEPIRWLGIITPIGGVAFIIGWFYLFWSARTLQ